MAKKMKNLSPDERHMYYEAAVQDPIEQVKLFEKIYREANDAEARSLCEDFCGTFLISKHWVERSKEKTATCIDLSPEPLEYGKKTHLAALKPEQRKRMEIFQEDVLKKTQKSHDVIAACNFSFYIFHDRKTLVDYFRRCYKALNKGGTLILEMAGGQGFIDAPYEEERVVEYETGPKTGKPWFHYTWEHESFEPLTRNGVYKINFQFKDGTTAEDVFVYDWRVWTLPEVRDCLMDAGFKDIRVYWEIEDEDDDEQYEWVEETAGDDYTWICYTAAVKT